MRFVLGVVVTLLVLAGAGLGVVLTGNINVAATVPHTGPVAWALSTTMVNSVRRQAAGIAAPPALTEDQARRGYRTYTETCVYCHGGPGQNPEGWAGGMLPEPPYMPDAAGGWTDAQIFWIVKNGVRMSGMPAFGKTLDDAAIWDVVAFVRRLPGMTEAAYKAYAPPAN